MTSKSIIGFLCAALCLIGIGNLEPAEAENYGSTHLLFHGGADNVTIDHNLTLIVDGQLTVEAWVNYAGGGGVNPRIIEIIDTFNLHIDIPTGAAGFWLFSDVYPSDNGWTRVYASAPFPIGVWTHISGVWDGFQMRLYINGDLVGSTEFLGPLFHGGPGDQSLKIGNGWTHIDGINGGIDEVRFSSVERYQADFDPLESYLPDSDTVGLWHFDEGNGIAAHDSGPNANDGVVSGADWIVEVVATTWSSWSALKVLY